VTELPGGEALTTTTSMPTCCKAVGCAAARWLGGLGCKLGHTDYAQDGVVGIVYPGNYVAQLVQLELALGCTVGRPASGGMRYRMLDSDVASRHGVPHAIHHSVCCS
jgi:hypothetical protein